METPLHSVVETPAFLRQAEIEGMSEEERKAAVDTVAANPKAGDLIVGSGGCRKVRVAGRGKGKSGGYRIVSFYALADMPVFLLAVLSKGARDNFTKAEVNAMAKATATLVASYRRRAG